MRVLCAALIAFMLVGCSSRPDQDVLRPQSVEEPAGARVVQVNVVTTRAPEAEAPWAYGANRAARPHYSAYAISIPPGHESGKIEWPPNGAVADPATDFVTLRQQDLSRSSFLSRMGRDGVGVYVHGYNTSYQEALYRLAQLATDAHLEGTPVLFSWPSQAHVAAYMADRDGSDYSRTALVGLLTDLTAGRSPNRPVIVLGHSMGGRLTMEALLQLRLTGRGDVLDRLEVVLAAPDIDIDLFRDQISVIGRMRHPITILVSADDQALRVSARLAARRTRLGQVDVRDPAVQALALQNGVRIVDITNLPTDDPAHSRYVGLLSGDSREANAALSSLNGVRQAGAFIFGQLGDALYGIGGALSD